MTNNHLSDEQIQQYLDDKNKNNGLAIEKHLENCPDCQHTLNLYKDLYTSLQKDFIPEFSPAFSKKVITKVQATGESRWERLESGFIISIILIGLAVSFYFINPLPLLTETGNSLLNSLPSYGSALLSKLNGNLSFVLIAVVIFLLVEVFDKKLLKPKV